MTKKPKTSKDAADKVVKNIRRKTRQTNVPSPQASQPRLTRGALAVLSQLVSGRIVGVLAAVCAV